MSCFAGCFGGGKKGVRKLKAYYTFPQVPNPLWVDIFAREKGIDLTKVQKVLDLPGLANRKGEAQAKNPAGQVPYIELDDGTVIAETVAICEYLEEMQPTPALIGADAKERGLARMWQRRMEEHFVYPTFNGFRFATASEDYPADSPFKNFFADRANASVGAILIPKAYKDVRQWGINKLEWLEAQKQGSSDKFICGDRLTMVDIQFYTTIKFFGAAGEPCQDAMRKLPWVSALYDRLDARPHFKAGIENSKGLLW